AEIFESRGGNLAPTLRAWHGQPPDGTTDASVMIEGRGFSVHDTRVVVGNTPADAVPISRTVLLVKISANAQTMTGPDGLSYYDVNVATPNGVSNHLLIEVRRGSQARREARSWWDDFCFTPGEGRKPVSR
ncbi:MAG TPA: IPT/TIG domain-containing protein, partial [Isosphaeraceae bacterium]